MAYRSILVHLDDDPRCGERVRLAASLLARERPARLVGVAPTGWLEAWWPSMAAGEQMALLSEGLREDAEARVARFLAQARAGGEQVGCSGFVDETSTARAMVDHGHGHDLLVMGQPDPSAPGHRAQRAELERVLLEASRPLLLLPYAGRIETLGRCVLVGWNGRRECARAAADALPLLTAARAVHLVEFRRPDADGDDTPRAADVAEAAAWLRCHGVEVQSRGEDVTDVEPGEALLSRAADLGADLIVAGAWGHARLTEWVLGGATRSLLDSMTVPVLMSR